MGIINMKINNLGYLLKEGIRGIFLHGFMSFAAVCVTVACLLIVGSFSCLTYNVKLMVEDLNQTNEVLVYVDETYTEAEAREKERAARDAQIAELTDELHGLEMRLEQINGISLLDVEVTQLFLLLSIISLSNSILSLFKVRNK